MEETEPWISYNDKEIHKLLYKPFKIYGKQFLKYFFLALIPEFILFGISQIVIIKLSARDYLYGPVIEFSMNFIGETRNQRENMMTAFAFLLLLVFIAIMYRSSLLTNITCKTIEEGKANVFWVIDRTFRKTKEILLLTLFLITIAALPFVLILLAVILQGSTFLYAYVFGWMIVSLAIAIPLIFYGRISMFIAGMCKDNLHVGAAIQTSWRLSSHKNYIRTTIVFIVFATLGLFLPWGLSLYFTQIYTGIWVQFGMIFVRGLFYPLFDIAFTLTYMNVEDLAIEKAVFSESIKEQIKMSKMRIENNSSE